MFITFITIYFTWKNQQILNFKILSIINLKLEYLAFLEHFISSLTCLEQTDSEREVTFPKFNPLIMRAEVAQRYLIPF